MNIAPSSTTSSTSTVIENESNIDKLNRYGWNLLHHASFDGDVDEVRRLLTLGADVDFRTIQLRDNMPSNSTALHIAACQG